MLELPETIKIDLKRGMASVKRKCGDFNGVRGDLALEQTQNRSSAISGGWTGITKNENALQTWLLLHPEKSGIFQSLLSFYDLTDDPFNNDSSEDVNHTLTLLNQRGIALENYAEFEILDYPKALADSDGFYKKATRSDLMEEIENRIKCQVDSHQVYSNNHKKIHIFDGMAIVYLLELKNFNTFEEFAKAFYSYITSYFKDSNILRVHVIFDRYDDLGIKYLENLLRANEIDLTEVNVKGETSIPKKKIKNIMANRKNKLKLVEFLCQSITKYVFLNSHQELYISGGFPHLEKCYKLIGSTTFEIPQLESNHLEANTRIYNHVFYNVNSNAKIIIHSADTDVFILAAEFLKPDVSNSLPAMHAFTGCDTTSRVGSKKKALDLIISESDYLNVFSSLGSLPFTYEQFQIIETFYLDLLNRKGKTADDVRKKIFKNSCGIGIKLENIPCTSDALYQHSLRVYAQTFIWKCSKYSQFDSLDLTYYGYYKNENGCLLPKFMTKDPLPASFLRACNCKKTCKTKACYCKKNGIDCVPLCGCDVDFCENKSKFLKNEV
ncbi:hypothetical protein TKK_0005865 [Trichogramma kaykai]